MVSLMTRLRWDSSARRVDTRALAHTKAKPLAAPEKIPVTEGLVECPNCGGGVRTTAAGFSDPDMGIKPRTRVYGKHLPGGTRTSRYRVACGASGLPTV